MGLPKITITFASLAQTAIARGSRGVIAMLLEDTQAGGLHIMTDITDIPSGITDGNAGYIRRAFTGYVTPPIRVIAYIITGEETLTDGLEALESQVFDYLVLPPDADETACDTTVEWLKVVRDTNHTPIKAILPNCDADYEGVINFAATGMTDGTTTYTTAEYCSRIAGIIAGTPMAISCTYAPLPELTGVNGLPSDEMEAAINAGKLMLIHDGIRVKIARGVNSLTTFTDTKGADFSKIKLVDAMDMIQSDIRRTLEDGVIGKYANTYDNKCLVISMVKGYLESLEAESILVAGKSSVAIDTKAVSKYLKDAGVDVSGMSEQDLREADTGDKIYLVAAVGLVDAVEEIYLPITI